MRTSPRSNENISLSSQSIRPTVSSTLESSPRPDMRSSPRSNENLSATSKSMTPAGQDVSPRLGAKSSARSFNLPVAPQPIQTMPQSSWEQPPPAETFSSVTAPNHEPAAPMDDYDAIIEDPQGPLEIMPDDGPTPRPLTPPEVEPVAAPLNKVHFMCFQEHRAMPAAPNVWCPVPCMTCHKFDSNVRYRCVFCCLRICQDCYQTLEKCRHRSLKELMYNIG
ncbi:hypothetical protein NUU61_007070 [Penicillium alfredii]|uniref:Uncharacterized protein n=1 Tax=Penicillium alfredii TaxID=1506179 RepID=A0A9W9F2D3_9EURO|nr:uncharacterized protein NUU61_007070 [Penicillium alfredii]KAJ5092200.1 hypothetical protein NUU61_007070 [Penicillium alfredii]